jgi:hypothetical protein
LPPTVIAMGPEAIRRAAAILAAGEIGKPRGGALEPGAQWGGDRMLLSVGSGSVQFVAGKPALCSGSRRLSAGGVSARKRVPASAIVADGTAGV